MKSQFTIFFLFISNLIFCQNLHFEKIEAISFKQPTDIVTTYSPEDTRLFIVQKTGEVYIMYNPEVENPIKSDFPFLDISDIVNTTLEGGLLGMAFHPDFIENGHYFVNYTFNDPDNNGQFSTRVSRFTVSMDNPITTELSTEKEIITIAQPATNHNGGDLVFGNDGYLYIPLGDGGGANDQFENGQNRLSLLGKILRIDVDTEDQAYSVPTDNPFAFDDFTLDEIWSLGWRNPWRVAFDKQTGDFWAADVGQGVLEEVDLELSSAPGGLNYGWKCYEGNDVFNNSECGNSNEYVFPVFEYDHSQGQKSITGGFVYRGKRHPDLVGKYIFTDFIDSKVFWLSTKVSDTEVTTERFEYSSPSAPFRVSTFGESAIGELYFATFQDGEIWRVLTDELLNQNDLQNDQLIVYPNPALDIIKLDSKGQLITNCTIFDINGKTMINVELELNQINISKIPIGVYHIKVQFGGTTYNSRFLKI
ncbi:MAG: PQQ-dependent sugar dehydrogenase [Saprospiraceae bacterium]